MKSLRIHALQNPITHDFPLAAFLLRLFLFLAVLAWAARTAAQEAQPNLGEGVVEVRYDAQEASLTLRANTAPLGKILDAIRSISAVEFESPRKECLEEVVTTRIPEQPATSAIEQLLRNFNIIFFFSSSTKDSKTPPSNRLTKVILFPKKGRIPVKPSTPKASPSEQASQVLRDMIEQAMQDHHFEPLKEALEALRKNDPDLAVSSLSGLLQEKEPGIRMLAAEALGETRNQSAVDALILSFLDPEPLVRQAAANGLARAGGDRAIGFLMSHLRGKDPQLQLIAAMAMAFGGDANAKLQLAREIDVGRLPITRLPKDVIDALVPPTHQTQKEDP